MGIISQDETLNRIDPNYSMSSIVPEHLAGDETQPVISNNPVKNAWNDIIEPAHQASEDMQTRWKEGTWFGSLLTHGVADTTLDSTNYSVADRIKNTPYMDFWKDFIHVDNDEEFNKVKERVDGQLALADVYKHHGAIGNFVGMLGAGLISPETIPLLFVGPIGLATKASLGAKVGYNAGAAAALGTATVQAGQGLYQLSQPTAEPDIKTSLISGAIAGLLGGGGTAIALSASKIANIKQSMSNILDGKPQYELKPGNLTDKGVGAAEASPVGMELGNLKYDLPEKMKAEWLYGGRLWDHNPYEIPVIRGIAGTDSPTVQQATASLFELPHEVKGINIPSFNYETNMNGYVLKQINDVDKVIDDAYWKYVNKEPGIINGIKAKQEGFLSKTKFENSVMSAVIRNNQSDIPEVRMAAEKMSETIHVLNKQLQDKEILIENLALGKDEGYLPSITDKVKMRNERTPFIKAVVNDLTDGTLGDRIRPILVDIEQKLKQYKSELEASTKEGDQSRNTSLLTKKINALQSQHDEYNSYFKMGIDTNLANKIAEEYYDALIDAGKGMRTVSSFDLINQGKETSITKHRALAMLRPTTTEPWKVMDSSLVKGYIHQANKLLGLQKIFDRFNTDSVDGVLDAIKQEYRVRENAVAGTKAEIKLIKQRESDLEFIKKSFALMTGTFRTRSSLDPFLKGVRTAQYITKMGSVLVANVSDIGQSLLYKHLGNYIKTGLVPALKINTPWIKSLRRIDLDRMGFVQEQLENSLIGRFEGSNMETSATTGADKVRGAIDDIWSRLNFMQYENALLKDASVLESEIHIMQDIDAALAGKATKRQLSDLSRQNLTPDLWAKIRSEFDTHGGQEGNNYILNVDDWQDEEAKAGIINALHKQARADVITPAMGEVPFWARKSNLAMLLYQFKPFFSAATAKITMGLAIHRTDARIAAYIPMALGLGITGAVLRRLIQGKPIDDPNFLDPRNLIAEGFNNSGLLGAMNDFIIPPLQRYLPIRELTRNYNRDVTGALFGPTMSDIKKVGELGYNLSQGDWERAAKQAWDFEPFHKLFYVKGVLNNIYGDGK